ncbi:MAG: preprotein translocase subunit SecE [Ectothiorhodospiraceae bacterium]|nr:preprotein translocase subunit SecE [Ectothiorhodospiraceae bacterium]
MKSKTLTDKSPADTLKLVAAALLLAASIIAFYVYEDQPHIYRVVGILAAVAVAVAIAVTSAPGRALWGFLLDARTETRKVVWPTGQETRQTTIIVIIVVMIVAIFLWLLDMLLRWGVGIIIGAGG